MGIEDTIKRIDDYSQGKALTREIDAITNTVHECSKDEQVTLAYESLAAVQAILQNKGYTLPEDVSALLKLAGTALAFASNDDEDDVLIGLPEDS